MNIREATEKDIREIVSVLKASLGEKDLSLSEEIWRYKHIDNPFGKSIVLIAEEEEQEQENKIIGVRAFMRWQWCNGETMFSCFRAVDTATHPDYQGRGVFKQLTLKTLKLAKEEGAAFVFNTPNEKSRPGYLKMGWEVAGKLQVAISPAFNSFWKIKKEIPDYQINHQSSTRQIEDLCNDWNSKLRGTNIYTKKSVDYLKWRYENNPLKSYEVLAASEFYIAGYIKKHNGIKELRIVECIYTGSDAERKTHETIRRWSFKFGAQVISFSPKLLKLKYPTIKGEFGPITTVRDLTLSLDDKGIYSSTENWDYSLGDLELF
jgi:N-acetylglutamate synthase-like GNAT family acetyltransferase